MQEEPDWKRFLRGGFASEVGDFACHPCDAERATRMFYCCLAEGISLDAVKVEIGRYLASKGMGPRGIAQRTAEVCEFWNRIKVQTKKDSAWVIYWEAGADDRPIEKRLISIMHGRTSFQKVEQFVEQYYMSARYSLQAKLVFSLPDKRIQQFNPCPAIMTISRHEGKIECGESPKVIAEFVRDLVISIEANIERIAWKEVPINSSLLEQHLKRFGTI